MLRHKKLEQLRPYFSEGRLNLHIQNTYIHNECYVFLIPHTHVKGKDWFQFIGDICIHAFLFNLILIFIAEFHQSLDFCQTFKLSLGFHS